MIPESILSFFHAGKSLPFRSMTYFNFLLEATLAGSILILVVLILRRVFRKQIGSRLVYLAWALVAVRLLLPITLPNPLMDELRPTWSRDAGARPVADQIRVRYQDAMGEMSHRLSIAAYESNSQFVQDLSGFTQEIGAYTSYGWLGKAYLLVYVAGGLIVGGVFVHQHTRFRRKMKKNTVGTLEDEQLKLYEELCARVGVKKLRVLYVDPLPSPCLVGVFKPVIALPLTISPDALSEALLHELYHLKAKDSWWVLLRCVCCAVHWFNPLVWIAQRFVKTDCELACDERVAIKLTSEERLHYANTLVTTAKQAYTPHAGVLATGMTMTGKRLKRRISAIVQMRSVRKAAVVLVGVFLSILTLAAFSTAESVEQAKRMHTAYPFAQSDVYPEISKALGEKVELATLIDPLQAEAQAKRYLCALYPEEKEAIESQYLFRVQTSGTYLWRFSVWLSQNEKTPLYYVGLESGGSLRYISTPLSYANEERRLNIPSILPENLQDVALAYTEKISEAVLQGHPFDKVKVYADFETPQGRNVEFILSNSGDQNKEIDLILQIAPEVELLRIDIIEEDERERAQINPSIIRTKEKLIYTKDTSITFEAESWGQTDYTYALSPDAKLSVQQAFDIAVDTMLEESGLTKEHFLQLPLEYGYYDKSNFDGQESEWRFVWRVEPNDSMERHWVSFSDVASPTTFEYSAPGQSVG